MQSEPNNQAAQQASAQIDDLLAQAKQVVADIDQINKETNHKMDEHTARVNESVGRLEKIFTTLEDAENQASDELDALILDQAEYLAEE